MLLRMVNNTGATVERALPPGPFRWQIGRLADCDLPLDGIGVSRRHAVVSGDGTGVIHLEDSGSSAGTILDGNRLDARARFNPGSLARIADWTLLLVAEADGQTIGTSEVSAPAAEPVRAAPQPPAPEPGVKDENGFTAKFSYLRKLYVRDVMALIKRTQEDVMEQSTLSESALKGLNEAEKERKLAPFVDAAIRARRHEIPLDIDPAVFRQAVVDELIGFGPLSPVIRSSEISEVMINGPDMVFVEHAGRIYETGIHFLNDQHLMGVIQRIVEPLGRHIDDASPMVDARLPDGSRVNAIISPLSLKGAALTVRKFTEKKLTTDDLIKFGSLTPNMARFLEEAVRVRKNILVSGGTGSGKTTLLNILSQFIPKGERVITIEDSAELKLDHRNLVSLEARPANIEGKGRISIRDLVVNTLRMRPDRIIVGECRGAEAFDMLQAMNTGHDGSLTTAHANSPKDVLTRLENMVMMAGFELPSSAIREQIASAIDLVVQQTRLADGSRKVVKITEVTGREGNQILMQDIFEFNQTGFDPDGKVTGNHTATGNIPAFVDELRRAGRLKLDMSVFVPEV